MDQIGTPGLRAERIIGAALVASVEDQLIVPQYCDDPWRAARVVAALTVANNHAIVFGFIVYQTRLTPEEMDSAVGRWIRDAVMRRPEKPIVLKNKLKRFLIEQAMACGKVKHAR